MNKTSKLITTLFDSQDEDQKTLEIYEEGILRILRKILPDLFQTEGTFFCPLVDGRGISIKRQIPIICTSTEMSNTGTLSFFCLSKYRVNSFKFFFEMISRWLVPEKRLDVLLAYATDFRFTDFPEELYTIAEVMVRLRGEEELQAIRKNFPMIQTEIAMGIHSYFYSQKIMEIKGLSSDDKIASIQQFITLQIKRFPEIYDQELFAEMQYLLVRSRDDFKQARKVLHLSRIIVIQYFFRRRLKETLSKNPLGRAIFLKTFRSTIHTFSGRKKVLSLAIGFNLLKGQEVFSQKIVIKAIQSLFPEAQLVSDSFFLEKLGSENMCLSYLEIEKKSEDSFTNDEIKMLQKTLPATLKKHMEYRLHKIFAHRNEEEVMRNIVALADQIRFLRDIPQVFITFDEQAYTDLYFTVVVVRVVKKETLSIKHLFEKSEDSLMDYIHDRTKQVGMVRRKYPKEATVFRLKISKESFLREDLHIDLYKARQMIADKLRSILGDFRDYNGGMIANESKMLNTIHKLLANEKIEKDECLVENFFFGLNPIARSVIDPELFKQLFVMLKENLKQEDRQIILHSEKASFLLGSNEAGLKEGKVEDFLKKLGIPSHEFIYSSIYHKGLFRNGVICTSHDKDKRKEICNLLSQGGN